MSISERIQRLCKDQSGMTLIDIAIVMMVLGLLLVPAIQTYKYWKYDKDVGTTSGNRLAIHKAVADFYFEQGRYPCPADPSLGPGNANYGNENCTGVTQFGTARIGAVPWATLKIPARMSLDGWKNKLTYGVTRNLTATATWNGNGLLRVRGLNAVGANQCETIPVHDLNTTVHYLLVSHGPSGLGARTAEGTLRQACPAAGAALDAENCINNDTFIADVCVASDRAGANFYDDLVDYKTSVPTRIWEYSPVDPTDILSGLDVGINNNNPQFDLDVGGNIRANTNNTMNICDENGANCFPANMIGGSGINCSGSSSTAMSGIANAGIRCQVGYSVSSTTCNFGAGEYVTGIDASGNIQCGT